MKSVIFTWCNPNYFKFCEALIKSIRHSGNDHKIILHLMDFNPDEKEAVSNRLRNVNVDYWESSWQDFPAPVSNKFEYYRNNRPRFFIKLLNEYEKVITLGANGLVFRDLSFIDDYLDECDFVFLERRKQNLWTPSPDYFRCIKDLKKAFIDHSLDLDKVFETTSGKLVLLGTHAFRRTAHVKKVLEKWRDYVESPSKINKTYSDMNLFVKSLIEYEIEHDYEFNNYTALPEKREGNSLCDTHLISESIWFAKGPSKFHNEKYLNQVNKYLSLYS